MTATPNTRRVLAVLVSADVPMWGVTIAHKAGIAYNTARPVIVRIEQRGWLDRTKGRAPRGGPRRHMFQLTPDGRTQAEALLKET